jgi:hypothetical protein
MKRKFLTTTLLVCCVAVCLAAIADLTGRWNGEITMADGSEVMLTYVFKVDGEKLGGSIITPQGELPIYDGKIKGTDFTFKVDVGDSPIVNTGKFYGDSVAMDATLEGRKLHSKLLRADR